MLMTFYSFSCSLYNSAFDVEYFMEGKLKYELHKTVLVWLLETKFDDNMEFVLITAFF